MIADDLHLLITMLQAIFTGFGIFILVTSFLRLKNEKRKQWVADHTGGAVAVVKWASMVYLLVWMVQLYTTLQSPEGKEALAVRSAGPYALAYWVYQLAYGILPQLFWIEKVRNAKAARVLIGILLLVITNIERITILLSIFNRDYVPSGWTVTYPVLFAVAHQLIAVGTLLAFTYLLKTYRTNIN